MEGPRQVVLVLDATAPTAPVLACTRRFAPSLSHLHLVSLHGTADQPELQALLAALEPHAWDLSLESAFDAAQVAQAAHERHAGLVVIGPWPTLPARSRALAVLQLVARHDVNVLAVSAHCGAAAAIGGHAAVVLDPRSEALAQTAAAVRELPGLDSLTLLLRGPANEEDEVTLGALFPAHRLELVPMIDAEPLALAQAAETRGAELLVVPSVDVSASTLMSSIFSGRVLDDVAVPVLLLHHDASSTGLFAERLWATDALRIPGQPLKVLLERSTALGRSALKEGEAFFLVGAEARGALVHDRGVVAVPLGWVPATAGALALCSTTAATPVASVRVLSPRGPLALVDARFPLERLGDVEPFARDHQLAVVRLRADQPLHVLRERFDAAVPWGGPVALLDASALLDDEGAGDVPSSVDALRLQRLGLRLQAAGVPVVAGLVPEGPELRAPTFATWTSAQLLTRSPTQPLSPPPARVEDAEDRWRLLTGASLVEGHAVTLELDNERARRRLIESIDCAQERVHWQSYMVDHDPISEEVVEALRRAGARGVTVRVLVDALYSLHEVFGAKNPVLAGLEQAPGVEVRAARALTALPGLIDLKQRNHRKLSCIDRRQGTVTGRNLGAPYYRGFGEQPITAHTSWHDVPWLDAGVVLEGPLVESLDRSFLTDWVRAGGAPFEVSPCAKAGDAACRLVLHEGLRDTHTLEAQLELVRTARERLVLVNTFPLVLELQRALVDACRRGVKVEVLFGSVRPVWGDDQPFASGAIRALADELVRARLTPVLQGGGRGYLYTVPVEGLGPVFSHVHAKVFVRDDDAVAVGSANTDVTSAYWESEATLVVHDRAFTRAALDALEGLMQAARPVDLSSDSWLDVQGRREWLSRNWPTLIP